MHGWTTPGKATQLYELTLKIKPKVAMEIGVWGGRGILPIALAIKELGTGMVYAVDPWNAKESENGQVEKASADWWGQQDHEAIYQSFLWFVKKHGVEKYVNVNRTTSNDLKPPGEIDLLIIDGNHGEQALLDAKKFAQLVPLGGYCLLDDLDWIGGYVRKAEQFLISLGFAFVKVIDGQTGLYQRMEMADGRLQMENAEQRTIPDEPPRLTVAYVTARQEPNFQWFFDSLANQLGPHDKVKVIIVDLLADKRNQEAYEKHGLEVRWVEPKPTVWQGKHRITKQDWWAMSNARNTAFCLCETEWIACLDDRCVLLPSWLDAVKLAIAGNYIVVGSYEKRSNMLVERGFIKGFEKLIGTDKRLETSPKLMRNCPHSWFFGCTFALPLEVALKINGFEEGCDGMSMEDVIFGLNLRNAGYHITFDPNLRMIEDRTEGEISSGHSMGGVMRRTDKGKSPDDKTHAALKRFGVLKRTEFTADLVGLRDYYRAKKAWPPLPISERTDWYDGQPISDFQ